MQKADLIAFEKDIAECFERGEIKGPVHLSGGNEDQLIEIFKDIRRTDWVLSTWRNHYHALLHGVPPEKLKAHLLRGPSMNVNFPEHRFMTSAIVGGMCSIGCGLARGGQTVWCFVGDMGSTTGAFHEAKTYAEANDLPIRFIVEDNGYSTNSLTVLVWGAGWGLPSATYRYDRIYPHVGIGKWVTF